MKCKIFTCKDEVKGNYPCCSADHNDYLRVIRSGLDSWFTANENLEEDDEDNLRNMFSTNEVIYYSQLK
jgi:hypothetical protein